MTINPDIIYKLPLYNKQSRDAPENFQECISLLHTQAIFENTLSFLSKRSELFQNHLGSRPF